MKGLVLAGGTGTRLRPLTLAVSKQLLPVYNKPMIYYPLSALMLAGIREILVISAPEHLQGFSALLGDGTSFGLSISYAKQQRPDGLAQAYIIGAEFIGDDASALILGDNLFFGQGLREMLARVADLRTGATIFSYYVRDPERYGVLEFDGNGRAVGIEEKPTRPKSHYAVPGLYMCDSEAVAMARELKPSARGELEITDILRRYLAANRLRVEPMGRGMAWLDTGTHDALLQAASFIAAVEERQGLMVGAIEEVAFRMGYIDREQLARLAHPLQGTEYGRALLRIAEETDS